MSSIAVGVRIKVRIIHFKNLVLYFSRLPSTVAVSRFITTQSYNNSKTTLSNFDLDSFKGSNSELNIQYTAQIKESIMYESEEYFFKTSSYTGLIEGFQSLRQNNDLCDIKLETDDKQIVLAHKVVLASACPYFHAMFTNFAERNHDLVVMRQIDSTALKLLVNFIYSGEIIVTAQNVKNLLPAANFLQLQEVKGACCDFLQSKLSPANCIDTNALADLYNCTKLFTTSELYIQHHFIEVINCDEFLSLSFEQVVKLISDDEVVVTSEEKVFECVIRWVKHELVSRQCKLPLLMEHVRLPLISKHYISGKVMKEPLIENCLKCKNYAVEILNFHFLKTERPIPLNIQNKPHMPIHQ